MKKLIMTATATILALAMVTQTAMFDGAWSWAGKSSAIDSYAQESIEGFDSYEAFSIDMEFVETDFIIEDSVTETDTARISQNRTTPTRTTARSEIASGASASEISSGDFTYSVTDGEATITGYTGTEDDVVIPSSIDGYIVAMIGSKAFAGKSIKTLTISDGIREIRQGAFRNCTSLTSVVMPDSITRIGDNYGTVALGPGGPFQGCTSLSSVKLSKNLSYMGAYSFSGCTSLSQIEIPKSLTDVGFYGNPFSECTNLKTILFEDGTTKIANQLFQNCTSLVQITLPDTLVEIGNGAFVGCTSLTSVVMPDSITRIGNNYGIVSAGPGGPFQGCTSLSSVKLSKNLSYMGAYSFSGCTSLSQIEIPKSLTEVGFYGNPFSECTNLKTILFEDGTTKIASQLFQNCTSLVKITLPDTLVEIGNGAFVGCTSLTSVVMPDSITRIGNNFGIVSAGPGGPFQGCTSLSSVKLSKNLSYMGAYSFSGCTSLSQIEIPKSLTEVGYYGNPFSECSNLKRVIFEEGTTLIANRLFEGCTGLESITIPETINTINQSAFKNCTNLRMVSLGENVTTIGKQAFSECPKISLYCPLQSMAVVYAIENDVPFVVSSILDADNGIIDFTESRYTMYTGALNSTGYLTFYVKYDISDSYWSQVTNPYITVYIPQNATLSESTVKVNKALSEDYSLNDNLFSVRITDQCGEIEFSVTLNEHAHIASYAMLECRHNGNKDKQVIGVVYEELNNISLNVEDVTGDNEVEVSGITPPLATVEITVDGEPAATVQANKNGDYLASVEIQPGYDGQVFAIGASCVDSEGAEHSASRMVTYSENTPVLTEFVMYQTIGITSFDLLDYAKRGITPSITHYGSKEPYKFEVGFENVETLDKVYVTSLRNGVKKAIEAKWNEETESFIAYDYFDNTDNMYVPGTLSIEYTMKTEPAYVGQEVDWEFISDRIGFDIDDCDVEYIENSDRALEAIISLGDSAGELSNIALKMAIQTYHEDAGIDIEDWLKLPGAQNTVYSYIIPGLDDSKYVANIDFSNPEDLAMIVYDVTDIADTAVKLKLSMIPETDAGFESLFDISNKLANVNLAAGILYKGIGIQSDYNELCDEIIRTDSIIDKHTALEKASELRTDQLGFMLMTSFLPLVASAPVIAIGATMGAPAILFTAMLSVIGTMAPVFWELRTNQIKTGSFKIKWHIDPSGYVYDAVTGERLEGVKTTAYCVEYDESENFWDNPPESGVVWDASEWSQENPLYTDADGRYAWDVPEGWWQVKYEKEGYETTYSEWLEVPPPQTEVNIGMTPIAVNYDLTPAIKGAASKLYEPWGLKYFASYDGDDVDRIAERGVVMLKDEFYTADMTPEAFRANENAYDFSSARDELGFEAPSAKYPNGRYTALLDEGIYSYDISAAYYALPYAVMENGQIVYGAIRNISMEQVLNSNLSSSAVSAEEKTICTCILALKDSVATYYSATGIQGASIDIHAPRGSSQTAAEKVMTAAEAGITPAVKGAASRLIEPWGLKFTAAYTADSRIADRGIVMLREDSYSEAYASNQDAMRLNAEAYVFTEGDETLQYVASSDRYSALLTEGISSRDISAAYYAAPFVVLNDGTYVYGTVRSISMLNILNTNLSSSAVSAEEKAVCQDIIDLYNAVKAFYEAA